MARITVEDCLTQENNRFALVQLASKRTKQLLQGSPTQAADRKNKAVVTALREIAGGRVRFMSADEAKAFEEEKARQIEAQRASETAERERRTEIGAGLFGNGNDTRSVSFLRDSLLSTPPRAEDSDSDDEE
jgi:DNA-directed RNA polymerase subunit omega